MTLLIPLQVSGFQLRTWESQDMHSLTKYANDRDIWLNMRDEFPYPFTSKDAELFITKARTSRDGIYLALASESEVLGSITLQIQDDIRRYSCVLSYWVGKQFWGQGLATAAIKAVSEYTLTQLGLVRIYAKVFSTNIGSIRALEKSGFEREGYLRKGVYKEGKFIDQVLYAKVV